MWFYSIKDKKPVMVDDKSVTYRTTKNGKKQAIGVLPDGTKVYKFVKA